MRDVELGVAMKRLKALYRLANKTAALAANAVFAGNSALPAKSAFPLGQRMRWGESSEGFAVGRGLRYHYGNQTVKYRHLVLEAG